MHNIARRTNVRLKSTVADSLASLAGLKAIDVPDERYGEET